MFLFILEFPKQLQQHRNSAESRRRILSASGCFYSASLQ